MDMQQEMETTPFVTREQGQRHRMPPALPGARAMRTKRGAARGGSMTIKICACLGVFVLAFAAQMLVHPFGNVSVETGATGTDGTDGADDAPGRLRFVSGQSAASSVFSDSQRWSAPISEVTHARVQADHTLELTALSGDVVSCPASGEVREIDNDRTLGAYVRISHGGGLESIYYNLGTVLVELGQPVLALDTLGTVGESGLLYVDVFRAGEKQPPDDYILVRQGF